MTPWDLPAGARHPDVAFDGTAPVVAYQLGENVVLHWLTSAKKATYASGVGQLAFPRLLGYLGHLWLAFKGDGNIARVVCGSKVEKLGTAWGNDPLCLAVVGSLPYVYVQSSRDVRRWRLLADGVGPAEDVAAQPVGTGLSHVTAAGQVVTIDAARFSVPGMTRPCVVDRYVVGESPDGGAILQTRDAKRRLVLWPGAISKTPRLAVDGDRMLVCKWEPGRVALVNDSELVDVKPAPKPPDDPPPAPPKPEPPKEPPVSLPNYAEYVATRCRELGLRRVDGGNNDATRERTFTILNQIASELHATDPRVGLLEKTSGNRWRDRAIDILTVLESSGLCTHFDVIGNAEGAEGKDPTPAWQDKGPINAGRWREPYPVESVPEPPKPPTDPPTAPTEPPPPAVDLSGVFAALRELQVQLAEMRVDVVEARDETAQARQAVERVEKVAQAALVEASKARPVTLRAGFLGTISGTVGAPQA